jgi:acetylornithine/N-succinyldiaminopimelate aminotransferase
MQVAEHTLMKITPRPPSVMVRGAGSYLWDHTGKRYLDFVQGWAVNSLGHCAAEVVQTLTEQAATLMTPSPAYHNQPQLALACRPTQNGFKQAHFASSGAEANEAAIKLARKWGQLNKPGAERFITTEQAFHGRTLAMMSASGKAGWADMFPPMPGGFDHARFGDVDALAKLIRNDTLGIMVEPIQGEAGVVVPPPGYLRELRALADHHNLVLIFDEVQTGMGRTGQMYGHQHENVEPDIMTLGKGIGSGVPLSAVVCNARLSCFDYGNQGGTYNGNPLMTAVGVRVFDTISEPGFLAHVARMGDRLRSGLNAMAEKHGLNDVRGQGLLVAASLKKPVSEAVCARAMEIGLLINPARPDTIRLMPSLRVSTAEVDETLNIIDEVMSRQV